MQGHMNVKCWSYLMDVCNTRFQL